MITPLGSQKKSYRIFTLKQSISEIEPSSLKRIADRLQELQSGLEINSSLVEVSKLIEDFLIDASQKSENDLYSKWVRRKKDLLDILIVAGRKDACNDLSLADIGKILGHAINILLSQKRIPARYIESIGRAVLNNMGNQKLKRIFFARLEHVDQALGKRATVWKKEIESLKSPDVFVKKNLSNRTSLKDLWGSIGAENTWFGSRIIRESLHQLGSNNLPNYYREQLIGDYSTKSLRPKNLGILAELEIEELSAFVNAYCDNFKNIPSSDVFLDYLVLSQLMDVPSAGVKWDHPLIHDLSRRKVNSYLLQSDFRIAFDHILMHPERKQYWIKWLESGHVKRIKVFGNMARIKKYQFNCPVSSLEHPTLQMDLGPCYAYECGKHGSGALYVYPSSGGPMRWEQKFLNTRDYKKYILDDRSSRTNWLKISHSSSWQQKVDTQLLLHYRLKR